MKQIRAALAAGMMIALTQPAAADVKAGVDAWQQGDYAKAVAEWQPLAQAGDPDAQFNMGQAYKLGRGVPSSMSTAIDWYRKAAAQGHIRAEDNLGLLMFQQGERASALPYLQRAADRGEPRAQYIVGTALFNGDLAAKDWVRAYALMTRASASGLAQATASLKQMDKYIPAAQRQEGAALARSPESRNMAGLDQNAASRRKEATEPDRPAKPLEGKTEPKVATAPSKPVVPPKTAIKAAADKPAAQPVNGPWRVQLGAFSEEGRARALWSKLKGQVNGLSAYQLFLVKGGAVTRLQAGPLASSADAARLCSAIKTAGAECMPKKM